MSRRVLLLVSLLVVAAGAVLVPRLLRPPPSDVERIRALFDGAARAVEEKRIGDAVQGVSESFSGEGLDKTGVKRLIAGHVLRGAWVSVVVSGAKVEVQGTGARATVDVVLSRSGKGKPLTELLPELASVHRIDCRLAREEDGWRVTTATWRPISLEEAAAGPDPGR
jgi:hypothetical protein